MTRPARSRRPAPPLDPAALERLALRYVERFATTRVRLAAYLTRKVRERGWADGAAEPQPVGVAERMAAAGYIDDRGYAEAKAGALGRRGYGARRVADTLRAAGVEADDADAVLATAQDGAYDAALAYARRKRIGPFAATPAERDQQHRQFAAMARAGHRTDLIRAFVHAAPGEIPTID